MTLDEMIKNCEEVADYDCYVEAELEYAETHRQLAEWLTELKQLREQTRWIPCSERLPEIGRNVLISCKAEYGEWTSEGQLEADGMWTQYRWSAIIPRPKVIAWQPLPESYREESRNDI